MKIVHTSDWHAGRVWKNISRLDELEACLDHLADYVERETGSRLARYNRRGYRLGCCS
jgi:hypothetical protein